MGIIKVVDNSYYAQAKEIVKKYENETAFAEKIVFCMTTLLADIFLIPTALDAKKLISFYKSAKILKGSFVSDGPKSESGELPKSLNDRVKSVASTILLPFAIIDFTTFLKISDWKDVHEFFKTSPFLNHVKYAGIANIALIGFLSTLAIDAYVKDNTLPREVPLDQVEIHEIKITQSYWNLTEKTVKVASSVFSFVLLVGSYSSPPLTAMRFTFLVLEMGIALKNYEAKKLTLT